jgi:hypothetical protein
MVEVDNFFENKIDLMVVRAYKFNG